MKFTSLALILVLYSGICLAQTKPVTLRIDPSYSNGGTAKDIIDSISYIPLETNSESLFGKVSQLEVTEDYFIVLDRDTKSILFLNMTGALTIK